jgi:hypothetical protein
MTKHKLVGIANFTLGSLFLMVFLFYLLVMKPNLDSLYAEFNAQSSTNTSIYLAPCLISSLVNFFFGARLLFSSKESVPKKFKHSLIVITATILIFGLLIGFFSLMFIYPIYNLATQF